MAKPFVSIIIPCRNEEKYINDILQNIIEQDYGTENLEVIVADGMSDDRTGEIIRSYSQKYPFIHTVINERKIVPTGLNKAIAISKGEIIARMDAHSTYPANYISRLVGSLFEYKADNTGGVCISVPPSQHAIAVAISEAMSNRFGIGNAEFRLQQSKVIETDTVPFGCYRKEVFEKIGMFDEDMVRNQDDEFNGRLKKYGGKIILIPDVQIIYYTRERISQLFRMYYQYGLFKPLVNIKLGKPATIRQFFPPAFVFYLSVLLASTFNASFFSITVIPFILYLFLSLLVSFGIMVRKSRWDLIVLPWVFFVIHMAYGSGYIKGFWEFTLFKKIPNAKSFGISR